MTTGWTQIISAYAASYSIGQSVYPASWGQGSSIYSASYFIYVNGQIVYKQPINTVAPVITGTPTAGNTLTVDDGTWVGAGSLTYTYQWWKFISGTATAITGATSNSYLISNSDIGYQLYCVVTAHNLYGIGVAQTTKTAAVSEGIPVNTVLPVISGTTTVGQQLSSTTGTWTSSTTPTYTYQWKRDGVAIGGATASTYTLVTADYNTRITCTVTATNTAGSTSATSLQTALIAEAVPVNTVAPVVSGYIITGLTLSSTTGTWTSITTPTYAYQWKRNGSDISSATSSTYVCVEADEAQTITCAVTASNTSGAGSAATSNSLTSWLPSSLTLTLWMDANKASLFNSGSVSNNDPVSSWSARNNPGSITFTQGTSGQRPTYQTNIVNGRPAILCLAANQQCLTEASTNTVSSTAPCTIVVVAKLNSFDQQYKYMACFKAGASNPNLALSSNLGYVDMFFGDDTSAVTKYSVNRWTTIANKLIWHYYQIFYNGSGSNTASNYTGSVDTTALTRTVTAGNDGANKNIIGSYKDAVIYNWNGYIAEVIVFPSVLTGTDLTNLQSYMNAKYGL